MPGRRLFAAALLVLAAPAACGGPESEPPTPPSWEVADAAPVPGPRLRSRWGLVEPDLSHLDGSVGVKLDPVRRPARVVQVPARLEVRVPSRTQALRFQVAPPAALDDAADPCPVRLEAGGAGGSPAQRLEAAGSWQEYTVAITGPGPLVLELAAEEECAVPTAVAVSEPKLEGGAPGSSDPNIVFVVIDTLRRDFMDCAEATRELTPHLARWCERGLFFSDAQSSAPWTYPALASMLTGQAPWEHRAGAVEGRLPLPRSVPTAAERLRGRGYETAAVVSNWHATRGLWRGFDVFVELLPGSHPALAERRRAGRVVDAARAWLAGDPARPFFLWLVFIDLHEPVDAVRVGGGDPPECEGVEPLPYQWEGLGAPPAAPDPEETGPMRCRRALYREALRYVDAQIGRLAEDLAARGLDPNTWILVTSDHGEEFWDHAAEQRAAGDSDREVWGIGHGHTLYAELLDVPLLLVPPKGTPGVPGRSRALVAIEDVFPTLLGVAGVPLSPEEAPGNLARALDPEWRAGRDSVESGALLYGPARLGVTTPELRAVWTAPDRLQVFDRRADPEERHPLAPESIEAREGRRRVEALRRRAPPDPPAPAEAPALDPADRDALEALGYGR